MVLTRVQKMPTADTIHREAVIKQEEELQSANELLTFSYATDETASIRMQGSMMEM